MSQLIERTLDEAEAARKAEKALVWKIDLLLMPLLVITYGLQYYDKAILGSAAVFGIIKDLHLSTTSASGVVSTLRYSTANAAFYYGYIVGVLPWALLLQRAPISKTIGFAVFVWGLTALLTVVVKDYHGLVVQRVFLGVVESAVSPGFVLVTSMWYTKEQQASRVGIWYSATGIFSMFSGVVNYGLGSTKGPSPWKAMYYFAGAITMFWALVLVVLLPDSPDRPGRFFNSEERKLLLVRARRNQTGLAGKKWNWSQAKEAATDPKIALFLIMGAAIYIVNGGVTAFGARIIQSFGFSSLNTILVAIPGGLVTMVTIYLFGWLAGVWKDARTILIPISCIPVVVGALMIWLASWKNRAVPLVGFYLLASFGAPYVLLLSLSSANVAGATKKSFSNSAIFIGYNVGNIVAPYTIFTPEVKIKYRSTWIAVLVAMGVTSLLSIVLRLWLQRENHRLDALEATAGVNSISAAPVAHPSKGSKLFAPGHGNETKLGAGEEDDASLNSVIEEDRTEYQIPGFRFVL